MHTFELWVRINSLQTANIRVQANNAWEAKLLTEGQYGQGSVLNYTQVS
jgi:hypothetical protein